MSKVNGIGVDISNVSRFRDFQKKSDRHILKKLFTKREIDYCLKYKNPSSHFAGIWSAKEAASKALGTDKFPFVGLEIRHAKNGQPEVWNKKRRLSINVSITHTDSVALAIAVA